MAGAWVYILLCADKSYYIGLTKQDDPEGRAQEHNDGIHADAYTAKRRPVKLVYAEHFEMVIDAISAERRMKKWSRAKKEAVIRGEWDRLPELSSRRGGKPRKG